MLTSDKIASSQEYKKFTKSIDIKETSLRYLFLHYEKQDIILREIEKFFNKFTQYFDNEVHPIISKEDVKILCALRDNSNNKLLTTYICYLLSCTKNVNFKNEFNYRAKDTISDIVDCYKDAKDFLPCHTFSFFLLKLLENVDKPRDIKEIIEFCLSKFEVLETNNLYRLVSTVFVLEMISKRKVYSKKTEKILEIGKDLILNIETLTDVEHQRVEVLEDLLDKMIIMVNDKNVLKRKEGVFLLNNIGVFNFTKKQEKLAKIIRLLKDSNTSFEIINNAKQHLQLANRDSLNSLKPINISINKDLEKKINNHYKKLNNTYKALSNIQRLIKIITEIHIIGRAKIEEQIKESKKINVLSEFFPSAHLDRDGRIIKNNNLLKEEEQFYNDAVLYVNNTIQVFIKPIITAFYNNFQMDDECEEFLNELLSNNLICEDNRAKYVFNVIKGILNGEFDIQLRNILAELEAGLRHFLVTEGLSPIEFKGTKQVYIDLNTIFKNTEFNEYRKCLANFLEEDYLFILDYLLIINPGGNIRNDAMHGNMLPLEMNSYKVIYLLILIIKLYFGFYCVKLEKDEDKG